jgi:hypothetical protein
MDCLFLCCLLCLASSVQIKFRNQHNQHSINQVVPVELLIIYLESMVQDVHTLGTHFMNAEVNHFCILGCLRTLSAALIM